MNVNKTCNTHIRFRKYNDWIEPSLKRITLRKDGKISKKPATRSVLAVKSLYNRILN